MDGNTRRFAKWVDEAESSGAELIPAATVLLLRDGDRGLEVLMVERNSKLAFAGGMWVFPGGRVDPDDPGDDELTRARAAAAREAAEEAGVEVDPAPLVEFSHWTPPKESPKRFSTWFFAGRAPGGAVQIDGGEITAHRWTTPTDAMARRHRGDIELAPPTFISLVHLGRFADVDSALATIAGEQTERFATQLVASDELIYALYHGDVAYDGGDLAAQGRRHRLEMGGDRWVYIREP